MNAQDMIRVAAETRQNKLVDGIKALVEETGFRPAATFREVEGSNFIQPVMIVEPVPGWVGPQGQEQVGGKDEATKTEGPA